MLCATAYLGLGTANGVRGHRKNRGGSSVATTVSSRTCHPTPTPPSVALPLSTLDQTRAGLGLGWPGWVVLCVWPLCRSRHFACTQPIGSLAPWSLHAASPPGAQQEPSRSPAPCVQGPVLFRSWSALQPLRLLWERGACICVCVCVCVPGIPPQLSGPAVSACRLPACPRCLCFACVATSFPPVSAVLAVVPC